MKTFFPNIMPPVGFRMVIEPGHLTPVLIGAVFVSGVLLKLYYEPPNVTASLPDLHPNTGHSILKRRSIVDLGIIKVRYVSHNSDCAESQHMLKTPYSDRTKGYSTHMAYPFISADYVELAFTPIRSFVAGPSSRLMKVGPVCSDGGSDPVTRSPNPNEYRLPK